MTNKKNILSPFAKLVEDALNNFGDPKYLGEQSPLAAPYMLAQQIVHGMSPRQHGEVLRQLLVTAVEKMEGKFSELHRQIIRLYYFEDYNEQAMFLALDRKKTSFHNNRKEAIEQMASWLILQLNPALQLEAPPYIEHELYGVEKYKHECIAALKQRQAVTLLGQGGTGKTSLGSQLANEWEGGAVLWYTIRLGLNDNAISLLHHIGYVLKQLGQPTLWGELIIRPAPDALDRMIDILRYSLGQLHQGHLLPLICIDEIDLLQPTQQPEHATIVNLLTSLRNELPILLIGQQALLTTQPFFRLENLTLSQMSQMLEDANFILGYAEREQMHRYTGGNPRLVELLITLSAYGESIPHLIQNLSNTPPLELFISKILQRLDPKEATILKAVAVFRSPAPIDIWQHKETGWALSRLLQRHLLLSDNAGGVSLLPTYQHLIYDSLAPLQRSELHAASAAIRESRGSYTSAAYHWIQANETERAIIRWYEHRKHEMNQGQSSAAYTLFRTVHPYTLSVNARQIHTLICTELAQLQGDSQQALQDLRSTLWSTPILHVDSYIAQGIISNEHGRYTAAKDEFNSALQAADAVIELRKSAAYKGISWGNLQDLRLDEAWEAAQKARYEAENVLGLVYQERSEFIEAEKLFRSALQIAEEVADYEGVAKVMNNLSMSLAIMGRFKDAIDFSAKAGAYYQTIGKPSGIYKARLNAAFTHNLSGDYATALRILQDIHEGIQQFQLKHSPQIIAHISYHMAEAYIGQGDVAQAAVYVEELRQSEEETLVIDCHRLLGEISLEKGNLAEAEIWLKDSIALNQSLSRPNLYMDGYAWRSLAIVYTKLKQAQNAFEAKSSAISLFSEMGLEHEIEKTQRIIPDQ